MTVNNEMPKDEGIDHTLGLLEEGYKFILNRRRSLKSEVFETRILGKKAICMSGRDAAEIFYTPDYFKRENAAPNRVVQSLFGKNAVQTLDGDEHRNRKEMLMSIMSDERIDQLKEITKQFWEKTIDEWETKYEVILYDEMKEMLCKIACVWAGVLVEEEELKWLAKELSEMYESAASIGPTHWKGRNARNQVEKWMKELIQKIRDKKLIPPEDTALHKFALYKDANGDLLDIETVAVEIINIYRPIVAISVYINFLALAIIEHPDEKKKLKKADDKGFEMFVNEVRRYYPFFPFVAARVNRDFTWKDYEIKKDTLALLDLYGTNHDGDIWEDPEAFKPGRFIDWKEDRFTLIPQGGGDYLSGHRCAGEKVTLEIMKVSLDYLANKLDFEVPAQDLSFELNDIPSIPHSRIILRNIRRK
ncbi:cytochrome P450 [Lysinibacillus sp. PLM2]|nr:cytochrome P450 [Lysinibacillus sp. PLM2]